MEWIDFIRGAVQYHVKNPQQREGQAYSNYLFTINQKLAESVVGTEHDPFYRNDRINDLLEFLKDKEI